MTDKLSFLSGGGEMGALLRSHDWSSSTLGPPQGWPQSLRTALRLMLNSRHPMYIWWGPQLLCFYNDACRNSIGPERHPGSLGQPGKEVWEETWPVIGPQIAQVMAGGEATWHENQRVPITRHGRREDTYWTYSCGPIGDDEAPSGVGGVLVICTETTRQVVAERRAQHERERTTDLFKLAPGFITILRGPTHVFEFVNHSYARLFGDRDYLGNSVRAVFPELADQDFFRQLDRVFATGERLIAHRVLARLKASPAGAAEDRFLDFVYEPVTDEAGQVTGIFCEGYDVTEQHATEQALRASEERYRSLFNSLDAGFCVIEVRFDADERPVDYRFIEVNPAFEAQTGLVGAVGKWIRELAPAHEQHWFDLYGKVALTGEHVRFENHAAALGDRWYDVHAFRVDGPEARRVAVLFNDISARKRAERSLQDLNATLERRVAERTAERDRIWAVSHDLLGVANAQGVFFSTNPAWQAVLGWSDKELQTLHLADLVHPDDRSMALDELARLGDGHAVVRFESRCRTRAGTCRWMSWTAVAETDATYWVGRDVTEMKLREAELAAAQAAWREENAFHRAYFENTAEALFVVRVDADDTFAVEELNPAYEAATGLRMETMRGKPLQEQLPAQMASAVAENYRRVVREGKPIGRREVYDLPAGLRHWDTVLVPVADEHGRITRIIGASRDVTAQVLAEEALRQAQKMEAVGQLTGGIAHDFNNLLQGVAGSFDLIRRRPGEPERVRRWAEAGLQSAERGAKLTGQLLAFSREQQLQLKPLDVAQLVEGMRNLLARSLGPMIDLSIETPDQLCAVCSDATQLEMALLNLAINARDAMPGGGRLSIVTMPRVLESDAEIEAGEYVEVAVTDVGTGMPPEVASRAFDPFFTTKGVGKGTGLGLSQVYGIARQGGGTVRIESRPGEGTTVRLLLPRTAAPVGNEAHAVREEAPADRWLATILVVDDDADVRQFLVDSLDSLGYWVIEAADGPAGLAALDRFAPDLMLVDFAMPGMTGVELARTARRKRPELPIVFASGYAEMAAIEELVGRHAAVLRKPFRIDDLQDVLARALQPDPSGPPRDRQA